METLHMIGSLTERARYLLQQAVPRRDIGPHAGTSSRWIARDTLPLNNALVWREDS